MNLNQGGHHPPILPAARRRTTRPSLPKSRHKLFLSDAEEGGPTDWENLPSSLVSNHPLWGYKKKTLIIYIYMYIYIYKYTNIHTYFYIIYIYVCVCYFMCTWRDEFPRSWTQGTPPAEFFGPGIVVSGGGHLLVGLHLPYPPGATAQVFKFGKTMGKPWENHGKTMGKPWENGNLYGKSPFLMGI